MADKKITLPTDVDEMLLNDIIEDTPTQVPLRGKTYRISWLRRGTIRKLSDIMVKTDQDDKVSCQSAVAIILNGYWKIKFFYWVLWRWFYYIKQYSDAELAPIVAVGKKKIPVKEYLIVTTLLTAMRDTTMQMTRAEANNILHEPSTAKSGN